METLHPGTLHSSEIQVIVTIQGGRDAAAQANTGMCQTALAPFGSDFCAAYPETAGDDPYNNLFRTSVRFRGDDGPGREDRNLTGILSA